MNLAALLKALARTHAVMFGKSGAGKSGLLQLIADALASEPGRGFTLICPHGTARLVAERLANPTHKGSVRKVHFLDFSSDHSFGINPFETADDSSAACHEASLMWLGALENVYHTPMHETPLLEANNYVLGMFAAHKKLTLIELLAALSLSGDAVREFLLASFDNAPVRQHLTDLHFLAARKPNEFLNLTQSARIRLIRWLGDKRQARALGQSRRNLDARAIMDAGDICLIDLSDLAAEDAVFDMTVITSNYFRAAKRRPANVSRPHHLIIDEAADALCTATAQMLDQARKFGLLGFFSLQRLGQLTDKNEPLLDALMVNTGVKLVFQTPEPKGARLLAETIFTGYVPLDEWKDVCRPTPIGLDKVVLKSRSEASHHAWQMASSISDARSSAHATAHASGWTAASGNSLGDGMSLSTSNMYSQQALVSPTPVAFNDGHSRQHSDSTSLARSSTRSLARQASRSHATSTSRGEAHGTSLAEGESESYITRYEDLPVALYSLEEQLHRLTGEIMRLPHRELFLQIDGERPVRTRTPDLRAAFNSQDLARLVVPRYLAYVARTSPYLTPNAEVDREIADRLARITGDASDSLPDPAAPEPLTFVTDPDAYARQFHDRHPDALAPSPQPPRPDGLRVITGGKSNDGDSTS